MWEYSRLCRSLYRLEYSPHREVFDNSTARGQSGCGGWSQVAGQMPATEPLRQSTTRSTCGPRANCTASWGSGSVGQGAGNVRISSVASSSNYNEDLTTILDRITTIFEAPHTATSLEENSNPAPCLTVP